MQTKTMYESQIYGSLTAKVEAGRSILVDGWQGRCPSILEVGKFPEFAPFMLPSMNYADVFYSCNIEITGRTLQKRPYDDRLWVRIRIEWVKGDEPNTFSSGWMAV